MKNNSRRNVLLTGASSGIGLATAHLLTQNGCTVWGSSRDRARLPVLEHFHPIEMELTDIASIQAGFRQVMVEAGRLDVLINNSGAGIFGAGETFPDDVRREQFDLLVHGPMELIKLALPEFRRQQSGRIVNVTSLASRFPIPYLGTYSAAKAAMASFSETLRFELAHTPIRVVDVQPGDIKTNFHTTTKKLPCVINAEDQRRSETVWNVIDRNMANAPSATKVAKAILRVMNQKNPPPVVTVGDLFQASLGPLLNRCVPIRLAEWFLRHYYKIG